MSINRALRFSAEIARSQDTVFPVGVGGLSTEHTEGDDGNRRP